MQFYFNILLSLFYISHNPFLGGDDGYMSGCLFGMVGICLGRFCPGPGGFVQGGFVRGVYALELAMTSLHPSTNM